MTLFLLLDFGATHLKSSVVDLDSGRFSHFFKQPAVVNCSKIKGHHELSLLALKDQFLSVCHHYVNHLGFGLGGIVLCSQMHGFVITDLDNNSLTEYISWRDERSLQFLKGESTFELVQQELGGLFREISGMRPRPGLAFVNALHMARSMDLGHELKILSLPEWLVLNGIEAKNVVHETMLAGSGFYDVKKRELSRELLGFFEEICGVRCIFNEPVSFQTPAAYVKIFHQKIPVYVGVGDHQCAVLGAGNVPNETISINLGTGSQVSIIDKEVKTDEVECRPYFDFSRLSTITHIPSGRALNEYLNFLASVCQMTKGSVDWWSELGKLSLPDVMNSTLDFDLGVFNSAWNYTDGGKILLIGEGHFTVKNYLASLLKGYVVQYLNAIRILDPDRTVNTYVLSGGVASAIPVVSQVLAHLSGRHVKTSFPIDETFLGLRVIALIAAGFEHQCVEAQEIFGSRVIL
jgi:sugar (pentulose or hexulose) kinase